MQLLALGCIMPIMHIIAVVLIIADWFLVGWLESVGSRVIYEVDYKKPILYVVPIQSIMGKLPLVPVGDTGNIQYSMRNAFSAGAGGRYSDCHKKTGLGRPELFELYELV